MQKILLIMACIWQVCMASENGKIQIYNDTGTKYFLIGRGGMSGEEYKTLYPGKTATLKCWSKFEILEHESVPKSIGWIDTSTCEEVLNLSSLLISLEFDKA